MSRTAGAMISVGREAQELLDSLECPAGKVIRLQRAWGADGKRRVGFEFGDPEADDEVLWREGKTSLHVPRSVTEDFAGFVVKRVDGPEGAGIVLAPPDAGGFLLVTAGTSRGGQRGRQEDKKLLQRELLRAEVRECAAKRRHAAERLAETEATYPWRNERLLAARERYRRFVLKPGADKDC